MIRHKLFIDGQWVAPVSGSVLPAVNPSTNEQIASIAGGGAQDIDAAVKAARRALEGEWGALPAFERGRLPANLAC